MTGGVREPGGRHSSPAQAVTSPSRSPSHDQRFFLKTQHRREVRALLAHLPRYVQHLQRHPHSLLARLLGTTPGQGGNHRVGGKGVKERAGRGGSQGVWRFQGVGAVRDLSLAGGEGTRQEAV